MTTSIGQTSTGAVFIGGTASGINTTALIDAAVQQKLIPAERLQVEIDDNIEKIKAYAELETLTDDLATSLAQLRGNPSLFDDHSTVFDLKSGTVLTSDGSDFSSILDISIDTDAVPGTYEVEVTQVAEAQKVRGSSVLDQDADLGHVGTFDIGLSSGGATSTINVTADMSLAELAAAINVSKDTTGVEASVLKVSETEYQLVLTGQQSNRTIEVTAVTGDDALNLIGVTDGIGGFQDELQAALPALVQFDGVTVTRDDNNFDDLVTGIQLDLKNAAPGTIINLEVGSDDASLKDAISKFVESYNALRDFSIKNQQVDENGAVEGAILFSDNLLEGVTNTLSRILSENFGLGGDIQTIRNLGITIGGGNKLEIDDAVLDAAIISDYDAVKAAFASSGVSDNTQFAMLRNSSSLPSQSLTIDVTTDGGGTITNVAIGGDNTLFTIDGNSIIGASGSIYEGITFSYQGLASATVNFELNQGLADRLINSLDPFTNDVTGLIVQEKAQLQTSNTDKQGEAQEIIEKADAFRLNQINKYANLEAKLASLNVLLDQIRAILGNNDDD